MKPVLKGVLLILIMAAISCSNEEDTLVVKGTINNIEKWSSQFPDIVRNDSIKLLLYEIPFGSEVSPLQLDSVFVSAKNTTFTLEAETDNTDMYYLMIENGPGIPLVNDKSEITVAIDLSNKEKFYTISGSEGSKQLSDFIFSYAEKSNLASNAFKKLDSLKLYHASDSLQLEATNQKNKSLNEINNYLKRFIAEVEQPTVAAFVLGYASNTLPQNEFEQELNKQVNKYPDNENLQFIKTQYENRKAQESQRKQQAAETERRRQENSWIGKKAPELVLPDPNGKNLPLSSFRGKYVLVDFWASWCKPCRDENPNVVRAYNEFKGKNFTILGVSLDRKKEDWLNAINADNLSWPHVSDLAFWDSKAVEVFKFDGIPFNVLIDPQGLVIAEGLRGEALQRKLEEVAR